VIRERLVWLDKRFKEAKKDGAARCAPYPYSQSEAELAFTRLELYQGQHMIAAKHMKRASKWISQTHKDLEPWRKTKQIWRCNGSPKPKPPPDPCKLDKDGDLVPNCRDLCMDAKEDYNGYEDTDGCPDGQRDSDKDGIPDWQDKCPFDPEDPNKYQDEDGCPDGMLDTDGDGLKDTVDQCPLKYAKTPNGCPKPKKKYTLVVLEKKRIRLKKKVYFATARAKIKLRSWPMLRQVAKVLKDYPKIYVCVEGHTDRRGGYRYNIRLSKRRAASVRRFLAREGISRGRMRSRGYGYKHPIDTNRTRRGRANNRRVEIRVVKKSEKCPHDKK
jgi:outer membrane protein OmpA-like peptidoglycan-associated protein